MSHLSLAVLLIGLSISVYACTPSHTSHTSYPQVVDGRLNLTLVAEDPEIVTPIGIAIDERDNVYVLESHTHTPPEGYVGPGTDQVKVFRSGESLEFVSVFADGIIDGMNLTIGPDDQLYVVSSKAVTRYPDRNNDGVQDGAEVILEMIRPDNVYDHAALLGIAASPDGWLYISRGNTGSKHWKLVGTDGSFVEGYGDGGNVIRCRLDGSHVEEVATGFWNPFDLAFDGTGRLLAIDNDPDSRGPNRLVDIVKNGDYGYKSLYGGSGIHPYLAWNGELPGTLPYTIGLGEAPSGMLDTRHTALPSSYENSFLITIWEESKIVAVQLHEEEDVLGGFSYDVVQGDSHFRPVAFASDSEGSIYFTDWVVREYPNHGKGRLWKLNTAKGVESITPSPLHVFPQVSETVLNRNQVAAFVELGDTLILKNILQSDDVHLKAIARGALKNPVYREWVGSLVNHAEPDLRVQSALILETVQPQDASSVVKTLLGDNDERVRLAGMLWAGRHGLYSVLSEVETMLSDGRITPSLFDTYLATLEQLQPGYIKTYTSKTKELSRMIDRSLPEGYLAAILQNKELPAEIRGLALSRTIGEEVPPGVVKEALNDVEELQEAAIFFLMHHKIDGGAELLSEFVVREQRVDEVRADAILALARYDVKDKIQLFSEEQKDLLFYWNASSFNESSNSLSDSEWAEVVMEEGNKQRGRRVFYSYRAQCSSCHVHSGWGGSVGPDLTNIGRSKTRAQIMKAILDPSLEIAPEWQGWYVKTNDGKSHYGRQIDVGLQSVELMTLDGSFETFRDIESYGVAPFSLMPEGLQLQLSKRDMRDLISFLMDS